MEVGNSLLILLCVCEVRWISYYKYGASGFFSFVSFAAGRLVMFVGMYFLSLSVGGVVTGDSENGGGEAYGDEIGDENGDGVNGQGHS